MIDPEKCEECGLSQEGGNHGGGMEVHRFVPKIDTFGRGYEGPSGGGVGESDVSTRSTANVDAHRDFDDFDLDRELKNLRSGLEAGDITFVREAFANIDEWLSRGGDLPEDWRGAGTGETKDCGTDLDAAASKRPASQLSEASVLRIVKLLDGSMGISFDAQAFPEPGHWGVVLADAIRDIAKGYAPLGALRHEDPLTEPQADAARRLLELLTAELEPYMPERNGST